MSSHYDKFVSDLIVELMQTFPKHSFYVDDKKVYCDEMYTHIDIPVENFNMVFGYNDKLGNAAYSKSQWLDMMSDVTNVYKEMIISSVRTYLHNMSEKNMSKPMREAYIQNYKKWQKYYDNEEST